MSNLLKSRPFQFMIGIITVFVSFFIYSTLICKFFGYIFDQHWTEVYISNTPAVVFFTMILSCITGVCTSLMIEDVSKDYQNF